MPRNALIPVEYRDTAGLLVSEEDMDELFQQAGIDRDGFEWTMPEYVLMQNGLILNFLQNYILQQQYSKRIATGENLFFVTEEAMQAEGLELVKSKQPLTEESL